jgi:hypothetical protein
MVGISLVGKPIYGFGTALPVITPSFRPVEAIRREIITQRPQMVLGNGSQVGCHTLEVTDHIPARISRGEIFAPPSESAEPESAVPRSSNTTKEVVTHDPSPSSAARFVASPKPANVEHRRASCPLPAA